jgi:hypothetical protein
MEELNGKNGFSGKMNKQGCSISAMETYTMDFMDG